MVTQGLCFCLPSSQTHRPSQNWPLPSCSGSNRWLQEPRAEIAVWNKEESRKMPMKLTLWSSQSQAHRGHSSVDEKESEGRENGSCCDTNLAAMASLRVFSALNMPLWLGGTRSAKANQSMAFRDTRRPAILMLKKTLKKTKFHVLNTHLLYKNVLCG